MALSKLVIGLVAGIGSVAVIGGITAGIVASRNNTVAETTDEIDESNNKENRSSNNSHALMTDESRRTDSANIPSSMEMKDPNVERKGETESEMKKHPDESMGGSQDGSVDSTSGQSAGVTTSAPATSDGQSYEGERSGTEPQQVLEDSAGTNNVQQEPSEGQDGAAASGTAEAERLSSDRGVVGGAQS